MAENKQDQIVIDVKVNTSEMSKNLGDATRQVQLLKQEQKLLDKALAEGTISAENYGKAMAENKAEMEKANREIKSTTAALQIAGTTTLDANASLDEQRQLLNTLQKAYAQLTGEAKAAADEQDGLRDKIKQLSDSVTDQEMKIGDARRNVGNYAESIEKSFGKMAESSEMLGQAASLLNGMGSEGKKAAAALGMLQRIMQLLGKAGKTAAASVNAQSTATKGATVAQQGLNTAMAANPIGLIVAGISTLLPLIQSFISDTGAAEEAQKKFNDEQERYNNILTKRSIQEEFDIEMMKLEGATEVEIADQRRKNRLADANEAIKIAKEKYKAYKNASGDLKKELYDEYRDLKKAADAAGVAWKRADDAYHIAVAKQQKEAVEASEKRQQEAIQAAQDNERQYTAWVYNTRQYISKGLDDIAAQVSNKVKEMTDNTIAQTQEAYNMLKAENEKPEDTLVDGIIGTEDDWTTRLDAFAEAFEQWANTVSGIASGVIDLYNTKDAAALDEYKNNQEGRKKALEQRLKQGIISEKEYEKQVEQIDAQTDAREKEMERQQAKRNKAIALMEAIINTAVGIMKAVSESPMTGGLPGSAIAAAMGAIQIATIAAEPIPQFAGGGIVAGTSYTGDNIPARVNSGEMILNRDQQTRLFDALSGTDGQQSLGIDYGMMAAAMAAQPAPVVVFSELQQFGDKVATFNEIASI